MDSNRSYQLSWQLTAEKLRVLAWNIPRMRGY